jgi:hypothetical protein
MQSNDRKFKRLSSGIGWGLFFILVGGLFLAGNAGWLKADWWTYLAIGVGGILVIGFLMRFFRGLGNRWSAIGRLVVGLALIYIGLAAYYGFGEWWPLALIIIGIGILAKAAWGSGNQSYSH